MAKQWAFPKPYLVLYSKYIDSKIDRPKGQILKQRSMFTIKGTISICVTACCLAGSSLASDSPSKRPRATTAYTVTSPEYKRVKTASGRWADETYALGIGKTLDFDESDESLKKLSIDEMASILADALLKQNYQPETDPEKTDLLIVVNWGKSLPYTDGIKDLSVNNATQSLNAINALNTARESTEIGQAPSLGESSEISAFQGELESMLLLQDMSNRARRQANDFNAKLLGFAPGLQDYYYNEPLGGPRKTVYDDLVSEIESPRYFVILQAYDFAQLVNKKEKNILWITRFSIRANGRRFDEELANMASAAASAFGNKSNKIRRNLRPGEIRMGEVEVLEMIDEHEVKERK